MGAPPRNRKAFLLFWRFWLHSSDSSSSALLLSAASSPKLMIPDKGDHLQHRHNSLSSKIAKRSFSANKTNGHECTNSNGDGSKLRRSRHRRRYNREDAYRRVVFVICGTVAFMIIFVFHSIGRGSNNSSESSRFIQRWKDTRQRQKGEDRQQRYRRQQHRDLRPKKNSMNNIPNNPVTLPVDHKGMEERAQKRKQKHQSLYKHKYDATIIGYDIYNCPSTPPNNYPMSWTVTEVLTNWPPLDVITTNKTLPRYVHHSLCIFNFVTQYDTALIYRNAELPFIIQNDPTVLATARKWSDNTEYLHTVLGDTIKYRVERSPINYFMWYRLNKQNNHHNRNINNPMMEGGKTAKQHHRDIIARKILPGELGNNDEDSFVQPMNDESSMTYGEWLEHAIYKDGIAIKDEDLLAKAQLLHERRMIATQNLHELVEDVGDIIPFDDITTTTNNAIPDEESEEIKRNMYYYFRLNANPQHLDDDPTSIDNFIYDELPFLDPRYPNKSEFYCVDPKHHRGINYRFGMRGVIAANHFDMSRNTIVVLGGERRYILADPNQCERMGLYPPGHPSVRHSSFDWTNVSEWANRIEFQDALVQEVVLHEGDVLYLPTNWFHFIVNLSLNYQCNARSGTTFETADVINACGFKMDKVG